MPISLLRFNFVLPGCDPAVLSSMYRAAVEMAEVADANGFMAVTLEEHHGVDDGWSPAPLTTAGLILDTVPAKLFATHTARNPTAIPLGVETSGIVSTTECVARLIRDTVPSL